jgi:GH25 family lysozyme M1 (1,4-beta-N-acetylmuramidase)
MLFNPKALASALLLSTTVHGVAVRSTENLQKRAQAKGIDVSSKQCDTDWHTVRDNGVSFVYIKTTEGIGEHEL